MNNRQMLVSFIGCLFLTVNSFAQFTLSGKISGSKGEQISFAAIGIKNTLISTMTDQDGEYRLANLKPGVYLLSTKCVGFSERTDTLTISENTIFSPMLVASNQQLEEAVVKASRVDNSSGMAYNNVDSKTLQKQNLGQDAPYMLNALPSVVINSDAGNGIGYTGIRIRGTDGTRINVTINGVPVNDAESQGTYFVDMPDLISSVNNIQVQRGVGTSANGAGAFGGSINFQTNELKEKPYSNLISSAGSYNTFRNTLAVGTGLMDKKFALDARASIIKSDGYIDRASSDLASYYLSAAYYSPKTVFKFINFYGKEKTYQAWNYVPEDSILNNNRTYNSCGEYVDANGQTKYYSDETDNYKQNNFQLHVIHQFNSHIHLNFTAHYTKGIGYYEQYRQDDALSDYNLNNIITPANDTITNTDLIRRLWLNNDFVGGIFNLYYTHSPKLALTFGGGYNTYFGQHYGTLIWAQFAPFLKDDVYYKNTANKNDGNLYLKTNYKPHQNLNLFIDMQVRHVGYSFLGFSDSLQAQMQNVSYTFFNPKFGLSYDLNSNINTYVSVAVANKEPNRNDFVQSSPSSRPKPEQLTDLEIGAKYVSSKLLFAFNFFDMEYKNQLVLNGQINNVGSYNRVNVAKSYRRGIELEANVSVSKFLTLGGNLSLSENKIAKYSEYIDSSSVDYSVYTQNRVDYTNTDIAFSPQVVSAILVGIKPFKNFDITLTNKYVSRQYLDNTHDLEQSILQPNNSVNRSKSINPYFIMDLRFNYSFYTQVIPEIALMLSVYNLLNTAYETNGYTYSYYSGPDLYVNNFLAPAAPVNFLVGLSLKF